MRLSNNGIAEFRNLHRKYYGTDLSDEEAEREALSLISFVATIQPPTHAIHYVVKKTTDEPTDDTTVEQIEP